MQSREQAVVNLPVTIMRGGTSKGIYILQSDLPANHEEWDVLLLRMMGSPDKKQIDGLGGAQSVTSKVAIVDRSSRPDADVDYTFAQVSVDKPLVSYKGNCGNISSGVGPFAIEKGLVEAQEGTTTVRIYNTNTDKVIAADVHTENGKVVYDGTTEELNKMFKTLFLLSVGNVCLNVLLSALGVFNLGDLFY